MNNSIIKNIIRAVIFILIQVLVLRRIDVGGASFNYIALIFYPTVLLLLPMNTPKNLLIFFGFLLGIIIDFFYDSPGVHAATCTAIGFIRPYLLNILTPRGGYNVGHPLVPAKYGYNWFLKYAGGLVFLHLFIYFSLLLFSPVYAGQILLRTISSFVFSMLFIVIYVQLFSR